MLTLFSLPHELIIRIFEECPSVRAAVNLSNVSKLFRVIWLGHERIAEGLIRTTIPSAAETVDLAMTETLMMRGACESPLSQLWIPRLVYIAHLAEIATSLCSENNRCTFVVLPDTSSYYNIRRCMLAFIFPLLRKDLQTPLMRVPLDKLRKALSFNIALGYDDGWRSDDRLAVLSMLTRSPSYMRYGREMWAWTDLVLGATVTSKRLSHDCLTAAIKAS
ncbi:hypothetical protein AUEXF2481DRAFT_176517 [Aureobasidium subglaciale EXF-2481]|uniref:F-box domain-containing protein n=1 Tax=Aureobasidium subglaciale (strain EXF-2481) TaxID=1043005 RepID=A0A074YTF1_AURSE|nr:uncharacterized protein AUEXF2481DRAFT_176517 [Aureobasidium subglaciale EXF-2481]KEQ99424.1 hypothetical protein AUEXF2481DRAFT_176517 [Aureobasidium subglaciale EXF-2481]